MKRKRILAYSLAFLILILLVAGCRQATPAVEESPTIDPYVVYTAAAQTADARMTQLAETSAAQMTMEAAFTPTSPPATNTPPAPTATITPTVGAAAPTEPAVQATTGDRAEFVADVTVDDGTDFAPGAEFVKTWRLQNAGTTTWTTQYTFAYLSGNQMGAPASVNLPQEVAPGATVDISVDMRAPNEAGNYRGYWILQNASGQNFGVGPGADQAVWVDIDVTTSGSSGGGDSSSATATATQSSGSSGSVSGVFLSVDQATVTTACPHTFTFTGQIDMSQAGTVTYRLEAEATSPSFDIEVPAPIQNNLSQGQNFFTYNLEFTNSVSGWARLRVTSPVDVASGQVNFSLTCE